MISALFMVNAFEVREPDWQSPIFPHVDRDLHNFKLKDFRLGCPFLLDIRSGVILFASVFPYSQRSDSHIFNFFPLTCCQCRS